MGFGTQIYVSAFSGAILLLVLVGTITAIVMPGIDRWSRRFFITFYAILMLSTVVTVADDAVAGKPDLIPFLSVGIFLEYLLESFLVPLLMIYLLRCCGEDWRSSLFFRVECAMWTIYFALLVAAQFTTCFYYISSDCQYCRSMWHPLILIPLIAMLLVDLVALIRWRANISRKYFLAFLGSLLPTLAAMLAHVVFYAIGFVYFAASLSTFVTFIVILSDQVEQYARQQREIAQNRANIMVLQMRPHFIYNTMTSIYYLCEQDPKKAQQVTLDFTTYLRKNFTAIASENVIPFAEELEHTHAYLAVEQTQFEDNLLVDYDTPHTQFRVPPLTLQPIVENAVKHGMDPESGPLHISITTRATSAGSQIIVEDDGAGFDSTDEAISQSALANIRQRLEMMCHGKISIASQEGVGTVVTVTIP